MSEIILDQILCDLGAATMDQCLSDYGYDDFSYEGAPESIWTDFTDMVSNTVGNTWDSWTPAEQVSVVSGGIGALAQLGMSKVPLFCF